MPPVTGRRGWALGLLLLVCAAPARAQAPQPPAPARPGMVTPAPARPASETIGSWVLQCPADPSGPCTLRHRDPLLAPGNHGPTAALEVQRRGDALVPVITLRGLPPEAALGGSLVVRPLVSLRLDGGTPDALACGPDDGVFVCAPGAASVPGLAAALPTARSVSVAVTMTVPGSPRPPPQSLSLALTGTAQALARLRAVGAAGEALPTYPGLDLQGFLDQVLRGLGYPNGLSDVLPSALPLLSALSG